jgi:hypothetical protein
MLDNIAIHVPTQAECDELVRVLESRGYKARGGVPITVLNRWFHHRDYTCIDIQDNRLGYCSRSWYEKKGYKIITLKEALTLLNMDKTKICKENLVAGETVIIDTQDNTALVLEVGERSFLRTVFGNHTEAGKWYTFAEAEAWDWGICLPDETIEINGKKYKREEVNERLKELKEVG